MMTSTDYPIRAAAERLREMAAVPDKDAYNVAYEVTARYEAAKAQMSDTENVRRLLERRTLRFRWERLKLVVSEWWLRVVLRKPPALKE
jgi:hypothetical protein